MTDEEIIAAVSNTALENDRMSGCAQAVLGALQQHLQCGGVDAFKAATILSGGVARRGETCGALLGALMAIGIACGRERMEDLPAYSYAMTVAQDVVDDFKSELQSRFGFAQPLESTFCSDIQKRLYNRSFNMANDDDRQSFLDAGGHDEKGCPLVCAVAAEIAAKTILSLRRNP
ncbi:MAG: C_GCAxxG_C_C family protein [Dehalococcoidia bacterium]|nr:C_GCAxxG_C_C family protein [Dehalococcoidia bacterium]